MEIPAEILQHLKCNKCDVFLSRGPVYLQPDKSALCGLCFTPDDPAIRNTQYEALVQLALFPCKYNKLGCGETIPFSQKGEPAPHEDICEYRKWVCPVLGSTICNWLGPMAELLEHCQEKHSDLVLQNPCVLKHNILKSNETTYIFCWAQLLFLLYVKVSLTTGKLYHLVRFLGPSEEAKDYMYVVSVKRNKKLLLKKESEVEPQSCLEILEDRSLSLDISTLRSLPGGYSSANFTVEVLRSAQAGEISPSELCIGDNCSGGSQSREMVYLDALGWRCKRCAPYRRSCLFCKYRDIEAKCAKHESYFCQQINECGVCYKTVERNSLSAHRSSACQVIRTIGSTWRPIRGLGVQCLVLGAAGIAVCVYFLSGISFILNVYIPVTSESLKSFSCVVEVTQPCSGEVRTYKPEVVYDKECDWHIELKREEFVTWNYILEVSVNVTRVKT